MNDDKLVDDANANDRDALLFRQHRQRREKNTPAKKEEWLRLAVAPTDVTVTASLPFCIPGPYTVRLMRW